MNSPESELYRKSHTLYGIDLARAAIAKAGRAIVVEGYTDVIALHQAGVRRPSRSWARRSRPSSCRLLRSDRGRGRAGAGRRPRGARGDDPRAAGGRRPRAATCASRRCPRARIPPDMLAGRARSSASASWWRQRSTCRAFRVAPRSTAPTWQRRRAATGRWTRWRRCCRRWARRRRARRAGARGRRPARHRPEPGQRAGADRAAAAGGRATGGAAGTDQADSGARTTPAERAPLTPREAPRAGPAGDVHLGPEAGAGRSSSGCARSTCRPAAPPALAWLRDHLDDPASGLPARRRSSSPR